MIYKKHFTLNYCNITLNFTEISLTICGAFFSQARNLMKSRIKSLYALPFIQITGPALLRPLHLILLLLVICRERFFS